MTADLYIVTALLFADAAADALVRVCVMWIPDGSDE